MALLAQKVIKYVNNSPYFSSRSLSVRFRVAREMVGELLGKGYRKTDSISAQDIERIYLREGKTNAEPLQFMSISAPDREYVLPDELPIFAHIGMLSAFKQKIQVAGGSVYLSLFLYFIKLSLLKQLRVLTKERTIHYPFAGADFLPSIFGPTYINDPDPAAGEEEVKMYLRSFLPRRHPFITEKFNIIGFSPKRDNVSGFFSPPIKYDVAFLKMAWSWYFDMYFRQLNEEGCISLEEEPEVTAAGDFNRIILRPILASLPRNGHVVIFDSFNSYSPQGVKTRGKISYFDAMCGFIEERGGFVDFLRESLSPELYQEFKGANLPEKDGGGYFQIARNWFNPNSPMAVYRKT